MLPEGKQIVGFPTDYAMSVTGSGGREVREGLEPFAVEVTPGKPVPIDLGLTEVGGSFGPRTGLAPVRIPKRLSEGAALSEAGVSLTPVTEDGVALSGEGVLEGASVFYGDSEDTTAGVIDVDTLIKPVTFGLMMETLLRSQRSPSRLLFKVGLPAQASVEQGSAGSGPVRVVEGGRTMAVILAPSAHDAEGTAVPVSMAVEGNVLVLTVAHPAGAYAYPITVDPRYEYYASEFTWDKQVDANGSHATNWHFEHVGSGFTGSEAGSGQGWTLKVSGSHGEHEQGWMAYTTQGLSHIWDFASETAQHENETRVESRVELDNKSGAEQELTLEPSTGEPGWNSAQDCRMGAKCKTTPEYGNSASYVALSSGAGTGKAGENVFRAAEVAIQQEVNPQVTFDTTDETINGHPNALFGKTWLGPHTNALVKFSAADKGIGIEGWSTEHTNATGGWEHWTEKSMSTEGLCSGIQCPSEVAESLGYTSVLPDGEPTIGLDGWNAMYDSHAKENEPEAQRHHTVKVDSTPPHNVVITGLPAGNEIGAGEYHIKAEATDGSGTTPSSGVKSITLEIDGKVIGSPSGSCEVEKGPCTAHAEWAIMGRNYAVGRHTLTVTAMDNADNIAPPESIVMTVRGASSVGFGPGGVDPVTGDFTLAVGDVAVGSGLTVTRSYDSGTVTAGSQGSVGPQWALSLAGQEQLEVQPNESVIFTDNKGSQGIFRSTSKGVFEAPTGDSNLTLTEGESHGAKAYILANPASGTKTIFTLPEGGGSAWVPTIQEGPIPTDTVTYSYKTETEEGSKITRPVEALAPVPANVSCSPTLNPGCRALKFEYAKETTAKGEAKTEWGAYKGHLKEVVFVAYNQATKAMAQTPVAAYEYDKQGRLRAEWDPRISPILKTTYGYDAEGHVTALTAPGKETWAFTYGTIAGDPTTGRIIKARQALVWNGKEVTNSETPQLSGSVAIGTTLGVSHGKWTNSPVSYGYQWEDCNYEGKSCTPIAGATNENYTAAASDGGHTLVALVTATNGGGSVRVASSHTAVVAEPWASWNYRPGQEITQGPNGTMWTSNGSKSTISQVTLEGKETEYKLPENSWPGGITAGPDGNVWFTEQTGKIGKITPSGSITEYSVPWEGTNVLAGITTGPDGNLWFTDGDRSVIGKITPSGTITDYALPEEGIPATRIAPGPDGNLWFTVETTSKIGKITPSGTITEYSLPAKSEPRYITAGPDGNMWFTDFADKIGKITLTGTVSEYSVPSNSHPRSITSGPDGNVWFTDEASQKLGKITPSGSITEYGIKASAPSYGLAAASDGDIWWAHTGLTKIPTWATQVESEEKPTEGKHYAPELGWTIEYRVPISGSGLSNLTAGEVAKWGQKDDPTEGMAIFPPDEPQGWPAKDYAHASITYLDEKNRAVNSVAPGGAIATTEYNEANDVVRTLSPNNRAAAVAEGGKSAEVAKLLDTESRYNGETKEEREKEEKETGSEPGTRLLETLGPQHAVRLVHGKTKENEEVLARNHTVYSYDEGAPSEGGPYRLVTKVTQGAQVSGEADRDVRTITTSYSGQEGLGWKLKRPTSVTASPSGLKLTETTVYDPSTGNVTETRTPASSGEGNTHDIKTVYYSAAANKSYPTCGEHPQWAYLPCETLPGKQPEPKLPETSTTYNIWDEPERITRSVGSATRTTITTYDEAGRPVTSETTSSEGTTLPPVTNKYSKTTGGLVEQSTGSGSEAKTTTSTFNTVGQLVKYTDASGNTTEYEYEPEKEGDGRLTHVSDGKGSQAYSYDESTGALTKLVDTQGSHVLTFTATHDVEGNLASESYPNGMTATYTRNAAGEATGVTYEKKTYCSENCVWFAESDVPSIHNQTLEQVSSLAKKAETYDEAGRLTQVQETPTGEGCTTRIYEYDEEGNRKKMTSRGAGTGGACAVEGGTTQTHIYDSANRLTDAGTAYDAFGDITKLSAADADGAELTSTFYRDGQLQEQKQGEETIGYKLDPEHRALETIDTGTVNSTYLSHYTGSGGSPSWTIEPVSGHWTRYVSGIAGFAAIETDTTEPELQLTDLHGNVVARASVSETATKVTSTERATEFGVPTLAKPAKYGWLGGDILPTELPSGVVAMGARSYVPEIGRFLQPDPLSGGSANSYAYTDGNPINETDGTGAFVENDYLTGIFAGQNQQAIEIEVAREAAARAEAERKAQEAAWAASAAAKMAAELSEAEARNAVYSAVQAQFAGYMANLSAEEAAQGDGSGDMGGNSLAFHPGLVPHCPSGKSYDILTKRCEGPSASGGGSHRPGCPSSGHGGVEAGMIVLTESCEGEEPRPGDVPPFWGEPGTPGPWEVPVIPGQTPVPEPGPVLG